MLFTAVAVLEVWEAVWPGHFDAYYLGKLPLRASFGSLFFRYFRPHYCKDNCHGPKHSALFRREQFNDIILQWQP